jgi:hypothetical protein
MRIVKEDFTHTEGVRSHLKKQMRLSQQTVGFETKLGGLLGRNG